MIRAQSQPIQKAWCLTRARGFSVVEVLLAASLFVLFVTAFVGAYLYGEEATMLAGNRARAVMLAEEGLEATRNIRDADFANLTDGTHGLAISGNEWTFSGSSDTSGLFTRDVVISSVDADHKSIVTNVSWQQNLQRAGLVSLTSRLTFWQEVIAAGDWSNPTTEDTLDASGSNNGWKVWEEGDYAYAVRAGGTPDFLVVDISDTSAISVVGSLTLPDTPTNIAVSGNYAYVTSRHNNQELQVIDISTPSSPSVAGTYNDSGKENAIGVAIDGNYAYVTFAGGNDIVAVDISTPSSPSFTDGMGLSGNATEIVILGSEAYVASTGQELQVIDISTPSSLSLTDSFNLPGGSNGNTITGFGSTIILGRVGGDVHTIDVSTPSAPLVDDTYNTGARVNDLGLGNNNNYVFVGDDLNSAEFQILDISTPTSVSLVGSLNVAGDINGVDYSASKDRVIAVGDNNTQEVYVFMPQ